MKWITEARQILHELKDWATDSKSQEQLAFLEERINGAERIVRKQVEPRSQRNLMRVRQQKQARINIRGSLEANTI
jgi:predicted house-cleaning noncanonical NTP pyrophosphatase (MazG superfamily)